MDSVLDAPGPGNSYGVSAGSASSGCVLEILNALAGADLSTEQRGLVQEIVWNCMDNGVISASDRAYLESLQ